MRYIKHELFCLLFICLFLMLSPVVSAAAFQNAYVRPVGDSGSLADYLTEPVDDFSGHWEFAGDVPSHPTRGEYEKLGLLLLQDLSNRDGYLSFQYLDPVSLDGARSLCYGIYIGSGETGATVYTITTTVSCGSNSMVGTVQIEPDRWYVVYSAIPSIAQRKDVDNIQIHVDTTAGAPSQLRLTSPCTTETSCAFVNRFSTEAVDVSLGTVDVESAHLALTPDNGGAVSLSADLLLPQYVDSTVSGWYMAVTVSGTADGGTISTGASYGESWYSSASLSVQAGTHTYTIPVPAPPYTTDGDGLYGGRYLQHLATPNGYSLHFQGVKSATSAPFHVTKVVFYPKESKTGNGQIWQDGNVGSVTALAIEDGRVLCSGKLTRQAVIDYGESDIALLAVPLWDPCDLTDAVELSRMRVSKNFTFTLPTDSIRTYAAAYLFYAAIRVEVPVQDPAAAPEIVYLPLSQPQMLSGTDPAPCTVSMFGLHGADTVGVFESNVSHVTVDVYWDKLTNQSGTGVVCSFGGRSWHLSQDYLETIDNDVLFYIDAGLEVSLRILSSEPFDDSDYSAETCPAETYLPLVDTEEAAAEYGAVLSYLCSRYTGVASITLGKGINHSQYSGLVQTDAPSAVMDRIAHLAAMTYEVARLSIPDVYIVVPFSDDHVYQQNGSLENTTTLSPALAVLLFADALEALGDIPWVASWRFESDTLPGGTTLAETAALPGRWKTMLQQLGISAFRDFLYRWEPETCLANEPVPYLLTSRYETLCQALAPASPRAVVLSLGRIADKVDPALFANMTYLQDPSGKQIHTRQVISRTGILTPGIAEQEENTSRYTLWDFATSYSAEGFIGSGGIGTIATTYSAEMRTLTGEPTRVLRATVPLREEANADGILLRNFAGNVELSDVDALSFSFRLSGTGNDFIGEASTVVFFLGAEDWRMEYPVRAVSDGEIMTITCPLTGLADSMRCGYIGVMLSGDTEITLDLISIWVDSTLLDTDTLTARFTPKAAAVTTGRYDTEILYILLLLIVATVSITVLLIRREREEEEEQGKEEGGNHV